MANDERREKSGIERAVEELLTDPDAPEKGHTAPPQTTDAEPTKEPKKD